MTIKNISPKELKTKLDNKEDIVLIDVREPNEKEIADIGGTLIPLKTIAKRINEIPRDKPVVIYCRSGGRSGMAVAELQKTLGFTNLLNLEGGILRWADEVDSTIKKY